MMRLSILAAGLLLFIPASQGPQVDIPSFAALMAHPVKLKPELVGVHPRVFVTASGIEALRQRAGTTHKEEWGRAIAAMPALKGDPPPPPGPQGRRSQN